MMALKPWSPKSQDIEGPLLAEISWLGKMYAAFSILALSVLVTRLVGIGQFSVLGVSIPIDGFTGVACLALFAHWNRANWLRHLLQEVSDDRSDGLQASRVLQEIRQSDSIFLRGFVPRTRLAGTFDLKGAAGLNVYVMEKTDPTTAVTYGAFIIIFVALLPFRLTGGILHYRPGWTGILLGIVALVICVLNWQIACRWLLPFSQLSIRADKEPHVIVLNEDDDYMGSSSSGFAWLVILLLPLLPFVLLFMLIAGVLELLAGVRAHVIRLIRRNHLCPDGSVL